MEYILHFVKKIIPSGLFLTLQPIYHRCLAFISAFLYRFPSRKIKIVGVTGTKGKTTTSELTAELLFEGGNKVALSNTYRFKVGKESKRNMHKLTMPGRFFVQKFLRKAVDAKCDWVVLEMTSEGVRQFRHKFVSLDALIFTNLSPEHIESHGSFEKYRDAKRALGNLLVKSRKKNKVVVANADDKEGSWYLGLPVNKSAPYSLKHAEPYTKRDDGYTMTFRNTLIDLHIPGEFNIYNSLASATFATSIGVQSNVIKSGLEKFSGVRGRVEFVQKEPFSVVVDNAHTIDSLKQFYGIFEGKKNICVLGKMGGGRDKWSRTEMSKVADEYCDHIILTNEDPVDEDPRSIVKEMASAIKNHKYEIVLDRREAIAKAFKKAEEWSATLRKAQDPRDKNVSVLITGKGTDPFILGPKGSRVPWDDAEIAREELEKLSK